MTNIVHGSCHCGACAFAASIDLAQGTTRCNCTFCRKTRNWSTHADPATFRVTQGIEQLSYYDVAGDGLNTHGFCANCGTRLFSRGNIEELGGEFVKVSVAVLDDVPIDALVAAPVTWCDGLHDNWWQPPAEVRYL
ncbi:MAG: GFA family protein [Rhodobacterales bacterium]|jgi:hypothetical protein|nr:GFA family protein [Rhodobacterales bacterium]